MEEGKGGRNGSWEGRVDFNLTSSPVRHICPALAVQSSTIICTVVVELV